MIRYCEILRIQDILETLATKVKQFWDLGSGSKRDVLPCIVKLQKKKNNRSISIHIGEAEREAERGKRSTER